MEKRLAAMDAAPSSSDKLLNEEVTAEEVAGIVAHWTGIPVTRMLESEVLKLLKMESNLGARVIGQEPALKAVADAILLISAMVVWTTPARLAYRRGYYFDFLRTPGRRSWPVCASFKYSFAIAACALQWPS